LGAIEWQQLFLLLKIETQKIAACQLFFFRNCFFVYLQQHTTYDKKGGGKKERRELERFFFGLFKRGWPRNEERRWHCIDSVMMTVMMTSYQKGCDDGRAVFDEYHFL